MSHDPLVVALDIGAIVVTAGALVGWLPPTAAALSIIWLSLQITEWIIHKKWKRK